MSTRAITAWRRVQYKTGRVDFQVDILIKDFRAAKTDFQYELYSGAGHGFSTPKDKAEERANVQSIASTERFLKEVFAR